MIIAYGFAASVLPVWLLLAPRDYLSTFVKLGTIFLLALGILVVRPTLAMPALTRFIDGTGPVFAGKIFPFAFITIACGASIGISLADLLRDDSQADHQGNPGAHDRLRLHADRVLRRDHGDDRRLCPAARHLFCHQQPGRHRRQRSGGCNGHDLFLGLSGDAGGDAAAGRPRRRANDVCAHRRRTVAGGGNRAHLFAERSAASV